jgi:uncharacterized protein (DUF2062 family)
VSELAQEAPLTTSDLDESSHERRRREIVGKIPGWYNPWLHLAAPTAVCLGLIAGAILSLRGPGLGAWLTIPITLVFAFGFEWRVHKKVLHRRTPGVELLYSRHELAHHVVYTYDDMTMRSSREWWLVLMPAYAVLLVAMINAPLTLVVAFVVGHDAGCMYLATSMLFFLTYEWLHLAYHLPKESFIGRLAVIARLREFHRRHHEPRLMKRWNFNVTFPLFDLICGTVWSPERERARDAARAERKPSKRREMPASP